MQQIYKKGKYYLIFSNRGQEIGWPKIGWLLNTNKPICRIERSKSDGITAHIVGAEWYVIGHPTVLRSTYDAFGHEPVFEISEKFFNFIKKELSCTK